MPGKNHHNPEDTGPVGERTRSMPAVPPPARPRPGGPPADNPTTEIDLQRGLPPASNATTEIDLSGGWPEHLRVPPKPSRRPASRVLGIDVGRVRVGLALSDPSRTLASPLETVRRAKDGSDLERVARLVVEHEVTEVVVGDPKHLSGASGASAKDASAYARSLAERLGDVPVHLLDERLTTVTAAQHLREGGLDSRRQRPVIDQAAAVVILQQFLDSRRPPT